MLKSIFSIILLPLVSSQAIAQSGYDLYKSFSDQPTKLRNSKVRNVTAFESEDSIKWTKSSSYEFNPDGLPDRVVEYGGNADSSNVEIFYDTLGRISRMDDYRKGSHFSQSIFECNNNGQVVRDSEFVFSSSDNERMFMHKKTLEYNPNNTISKSIVAGMDSEIDIFDTVGDPVLQLQNISGLRTTRTEFKWNTDKSILSEFQFDTGTVPYQIVLHKYKGKHEVEQMDSSLNMEAYWIYDDSGRVLETNSSIYAIEYNKYGLDGYLVSKKIKQIFTDDSTPMPKYFYIKYEYVFR